MHMATRTAQPDGEARLWYVAELWPKGAQRPAPPTLFFVVDTDGMGIPWFASLPDGVVVQAHNVEGGGPVVVEQSGRLLWPARKGLTFRGSPRAGRRWLAS
jgi:hypothetical protein